MKKIFFLTLFLTTLTSCTWLQEKPASSDNLEEISESGYTQTSGLVTSLKDAILGGQAMRCTYEDENGEATTLVQGKKMKVEGYNFADADDSKGKGWMVSDGEWMYIWQDGEEKGMKYNVAQMQETAKDLVGEEEVAKWQDPETWADEIDKDHEVNCKPASATAADFQPPADVEFEDLSAMMEGVGEMAKQFMDKKPEDIQNMNEEDLNKQMEQLKKMMPQEIEE